MSKTVFVDVSHAADMLLEMDGMLILTHHNPDGDTLGCGFALWAALMSLKKNVYVACSSEIHPMYGFLTDFYHKTNTQKPEFTPKNIIAVDTAAPSQLGRYEYLADSVVLAVDHHGSNTGYAANTLLDVNAASCAEIVFEILIKLDVKIDKYIASAIYTGVSTDTGCFRYRNTTANSHVVTAKLLESGVDIVPLNKILFETKTRGELALQRLALDSLTYYHNDRIAVITITQDMLEKTGAAEEDMSGINAIPRSIEGVDVGVVLRQIKDNKVKGSIRTTRHANASSICAVFGGGGHYGAAGFECSGEITDVRTAVIKAVVCELDKEKV